MEIIHDGYCLMIIADNITWLDDFAIWRTSLGAIGGYALTLSTPSVDWVCSFISVFTGMEADMRLMVLPDGCPRLWVHL